MFEEKLKVSGTLATVEQFEVLEGSEWDVAIGCYPDMKIISSYPHVIIEYEGELTPELMQAFCDKWNLKIKWRGKIYQ